MEHMNWTEQNITPGGYRTTFPFQHVLLISFSFIAVMGGSVIVDILIAKLEGIPSFVLLPCTDRERWRRERERERETFQLFGFTLKYGKEPMAEQWEDKLTGDLPSRSSLDRLDVILFHLSTSPDTWRMGRDSQAATEQFPVYILSMWSIKYMELVFNTIDLHSEETRSVFLSVN